MHDIGKEMENNTCPQSFGSEVQIAHDQRREKGQNGLRADSYITPASQAKGDKMPKRKKYANYYYPPDVISQLVLEIAPEKDLFRKRDH